MIRWGGSRRGEQMPPIEPIGPAGASTVNPDGTIDFDLLRKIRFAALPRHAMGGTKNWVPKAFAFWRLFIHGSTFVFSPRGQRRWPGTEPPHGIGPVQRPNAEHPGLEKSAMTPLHKREHPLDPAPSHFFTASVAYVGLPVTKQLCDRPVGDLIVPGD